MSKHIKTSPKVIKPFVIKPLINIKNSTVKNSGFTLIEVMIASVILFSVIATVSMIYRGAFLSSEKANNHINITGVLPSVLAIVQQNIREQSKNSLTELREQGNAWQIKYQWSAKLLKFKSAPDKLDVDSGDFVKPPLKYKLWQVSLTLEAKGLTKQYSYNELGWTDD